MTVALPQTVDDVVSTYLKEIDAQAPGLLEGLYLTGSVAMDDFQSGRPIARCGPSGASVSDIDFVAITSRPLTGPDLAAAGHAHQQLSRIHKRPFFDGLYLTWPDLPRSPDRVAAGAHAHSGRLSPAQPSQTHPVIWHELAQHSVAIRGPGLATMEIWNDREQLVDWVRANLDGYWRRWHHRSSRTLSLAALASLTQWGPTWGVLGVARIHHTIATGRICSKSSGGEYALDTLDPRWHRIINESLRIRRSAAGRSGYTTPMARRSDALDFVAMIIEDACNNSEENRPAD